jgi:hypothetical protein
MAHLRLPAWLALTLILSAMALLGTSNRPALANWSGQNGKITFTTIQQSGPQGGTDNVGIATMDPDGSHRAIVFPNSPIVAPVGWSADGTKLLVIDNSAPTSQIAYLTFDGSFVNEIRVTAGTFASWILDNTHLGRPALTATPPGATTAAQASRNQAASWPRCNRSPESTYRTSPAVPGLAKAVSPPQTSRLSGATQTAPTSWTRATS